MQEKSEYELELEFEFDEGTENDSGRAEASAKTPPDAKPKNSSVSLRVLRASLFLRRYSSMAFFFSSSRYRIRLLISVFIE
jgi:hypothetical protein